MEANTITLTQEEFIKLQRLAYYDKLTGACNRAKLEEADDLGTHLILVDMNKFKAVNDTLGHAAGDQVLIDFVEAAGYHFGQVFRIGGDEFVLLADGYDELDEIEAFLKVWEHETGVTASYGFGWSEDGLSEALAAADAAMYANKAANSNGRRANR